MSSSVILYSLFPYLSVLRSSDHTVPSEADLSSKPFDSPCFGWSARPLLLLDPFCPFAFRKKGKNSASGLFFLILDIWINDTNALTASWSSCSYPGNQFWFIPVLLFLFIQWRIKMRIVTYAYILTRRSLAQMFVLGAWSVVKCTCSKSKSLLLCTPSWTWLTADLPWAE